MIHTTFDPHDKREDHDQTASRLLHQKQSNLGLHCLSMPLLQATSIQNFRTSTLKLTFSRDPSPLGSRSDLSAGTCGYGDKLYLKCDITPLA